MKASLTLSVRKVTTHSLLLVCGWTHTGSCRYTLGSVRNYNVLCENCTKDWNIEEIWEIQQQKIRSFYLLVIYSPNFLLQSVMSMKLKKKLKKIKKKAKNLMISEATGETASLL